MTTAEFNALPREAQDTWMETVTGILDKWFVDPYANHEYCTVCRECMTCNLRPCRDGGPHMGEK